MTNRERILAVLNYQPYDRLPLVHFGFWRETLDKWAEEGHITREQAEKHGDGNLEDKIIGTKLGFDANYQSMFYPNAFLAPGFEPEVLEELTDGVKKVRNGDGVIVLEKPGAGSIPAEIDHLLKDRSSWEQHYRHRLQFSEDRVRDAHVWTGETSLPWTKGGLDFLRNDDRDYLYGLHCGSLFGNIRNILGVTGASYLFAEDDALFTEIIDAVGELCYRCVKMALESGAKFDFGHFWEDICFKNGPIVSVDFFREVVMPRYKRINAKLKKHGIDLWYTDCDGDVRPILPFFLEGGINCLFPFEVMGCAHPAELLNRYPELRIMGGVDKIELAKGPEAIKRYLDTLVPLVERGGYIPFCDHRCPPNVKVEDYLYYLKLKQEMFGAVKPA